MSPPSVRDHGAGFEHGDGGIGHVDDEEPVIGEGTPAAEIGPTTHHIEIPSVGVGPEVDRGDLARSGGVRHVHHPQTVVTRRQKDVVRCRLDVEHGHVGPLELT